LYDTRKGDSAKPNPYWRGPVWAPVLYLIYDAIKEKSDGILADKIAVRFTETVEKNGGFFYENYDAITGVGYDDTGYGWTAAVYLLLKTI
jgi:neutral trehalase